jgi:GNAT superfamily N-acetyltransferase
MVTPGCPTTRHAARRDLPGSALVRPARTDDVPRLRDIERAAGELFRPLGMARVADDDPPPAEALELRIAAGRLWVAADTGDVALAYLMADPVGVHAHVEQVSVHPAAARRRLGAALIERARQWGKDASARDLTLCTFVDVPWNAPYYRRLGFAAVPDAALDPPLAALRRREHELGLDQWPRTVMSRSLAWPLG